MIDIVMAIAAPLAKTYGINKAIEIAYEQLGLTPPTKTQLDVLTGGGINRAFSPASLGNIAKRGAVNLGVRSLLGSVPLGPLAVAGGIAYLGNQFNPLNPNARNYNPNLRGQVGFLSNQTGMIGTNPSSGLLQYGPESVLRGKNVVSMFGTNNYRDMLIDKTNYFAKQKEKKGFLTKGQEKKLDDTKKELGKYDSYRADIRDKAKPKYGLGSFTRPNMRDVAGNGGSNTGNMSASDFSDDSPGTPFRKGGLASLYG